MSDLTAKQEAFALAYLETGNASEAYRRAYDVGQETKPETIWPAASRLLADAKVAARVRQLREEAKALTLISVGTLTERLEEARVKAMAEAKGASAAVGAIMAVAKLHGLLVDRIEATGKDGKDLVPEGKSGRALAREIAFALASGLKDSAEE